MPPRSSIVLGAILAHGCASAPASVSPSTHHDPVRFSLPSDDGRLVQVPLSSSKATVVDFFSPTCVPCKDKVPALVRKQDALRSAGASLVLVGVLADSESTEDAARALQAWGVEPVHFLVDRGNVAQSAAGVRELPATLVLDAAGNVRWTAPATASADDIVAAVSR